jgi:hypothetical protein
MEELTQFLKDLSHPEQYGWAVSPEVRKKALILLCKIDGKVLVTPYTKAVLECRELMNKGSELS